MIIRQRHPKGAAGFMDRSQRDIAFISAIVLSNAKMRVGFAISAIGHQFLNMFKQHLRPIYRWVSNVYDFEGIVMIIMVSASHRINTNRLMNVCVSVTFDI